MQPYIQYWGQGQLSLMVSLLPWYGEGERRSPAYLQPAASGLSVMASSHRSTRPLAKLFT